MLNKIYPMLVLLHAGLCYTQKTEFSMDSYCEPYEAVYSVLSNLDGDLEIRLSQADSLLQIAIEEGEKLDREICFNNYCIDGCYNINIPRSIFYKVPYGKWIEVAGYSKKNNIMLNPSTDTIYEIRNRMPSCTIITDPPTYIRDACSLHFSSKKSKKSEQIILINDTAYKIVKRKDGSTVLRKAD